MASTSSGNTNSHAAQYLLVEGASSSFVQALQQLVYVHVAETLDRSSDIYQASMERPACIPRTPMTTPRPVEPQKMPTQDSQGSSSSCAPTSLPPCNHLLSERLDLPDLASETCKTPLPPNNARPSLPETAGSSTRQISPNSNNAAAESLHSETPDSQAQDRACSKDLQAYSLDRGSSHVTVKSSVSRGTLKSSMSHKSIGSVGPMMAHASSMASMLGFPGRESRRKRRKSVEDLVIAVQGEMAEQRQRLSLDPDNASSVPRTSETIDGTFSTQLTLHNGNLWKLSSSMDTHSSEVLLPWSHWVNWRRRSFVMHQHDGDVELMYVSEKGISDTVDFCTLQRSNDSAELLEMSPIAMDVLSDAEKLELGKHLREYQLAIAPSEVKNFWENVSAEEFSKEVPGALYPFRILWKHAFDGEHFEVVAADSALERTRWMSSISQAIQAGENKLRQSQLLQRKASYMSTTSSASIRKRSSMSSQVWLAMEDSESSAFASAYEWVMSALIFASVLNPLLLAINERPLVSRLATSVLELVFDFIFTVDITVRFAVCPNYYVFLLNLHNAIDCLVVLVLAARCSVGVVLPRIEDATGMEYVLLLFLPSLRLLKMLRHMPNFTLLFGAFALAFETLPSLLFVLFQVTLAFASIIYTLELEAPIPTNLSDSIWMTLVTMTTVGYGDVVPQTHGGKMATSCLVIVSLMYMAVPLGLIGHAFTEVWADRHRILLVQKMRGCIAQCGYTAETLMALFGHFDTDGSGGIDLAEFRDMIEEMGLGMTDVLIERLFTSFDKTGTNSISDVEFVQALFPNYSHDLAPSTDDADNQW